MVRISLPTPGTAVSPPPVAETAPARRRRPHGARRYSRLNTVTGRLLVVLVILSAIPVASNRPSWWLMWTALLGVGAMAYVVRTHLLMRRRPLQISAFRLFFALAVLVPIYAVVQAAPIADLLPSGWLSLPPALPADLYPGSISVMPGASVLGAIRAVGFLIFLMLAIEVGTQPDRVHGLGLLLMGGLILHAIFGLVALRLLDDYSLWGVKTAYQGMLTGTFINRNSIATFLGFGLVLGIAFAMERTHQAAQAQPDRGYTTFLTAQRLEGLGLWLAISVLALAILFTQSRMGVAATLVGAFTTFVALRLAHRTRPRRIVAEIGLGLLVLVAFLVPVAGTGVVERALFTLVESSERLAIYAQTWGMIRARPLAGFGYDAFAPAFELYRAEPLASAGYVDLAHNSYLALWAEQGLIIGSIPMLLILWAAGMIAGKLRRREGDAAMNAAALGAILLGAVHSLADFSLEIPANTYCFLLILGLAMARPRLSDLPAAKAAR